MMKIDNGNREWFMKHESTGAYPVFKPMSLKLSKYVLETAAELYVFIANKQR